MFTKLKKLLRDWFEVVVYENPKDDKRPKEIKIDEVLQWMASDICERYNCQYKYYLTVRSFQGQIIECDCKLDFIPEYQRVNDFRRNTDPDRVRELLITSEVLQIIEDMILTKKHFRCDVQWASVTSTVRFSDEI